MGEDATLSQPATVDLSALLTGLDIEAVTELTLTASRPKANVSGTSRAGGPFFT